MQLKLDVVTLSHASFSLRDSSACRLSFRRHVWSKDGPLPLVLCMCGNVWSMQCFNPPGVTVEIIS